MNEKVKYRWNPYAKAWEFYSDVSKDWCVNEMIDLDEKDGIEILSQDKYIEIVPFK